MKGEKCMKRVTRWFDKTHAILVDAEENPEVRYATEKLAKYEDLEEQGRLIKLLSFGAAAFTILIALLTGMR